MRSALPTLALAAALALPAAATERPREPLATASPPAAPRPAPEAVVTAPPAPYDPDSGAELLGTPAPAWEVARWVRGGPLSLDRLRGKVVLVRWWTEGCHFCEATLPGIERLRLERADDGLVVVGMFHPKPPRELPDARILRRARELGFGGPIGFDRDWKSLERFWLDGHPERNWTSVSFLVDRDGRIVWVHGGGEYHRTDDPAHHRCNVQWEELLEALDAALARPASPPPAP